MSYRPSFWEENSFLAPYDLIVIGAGIVGLSSALFYKREHPEARIAVVERGFLPKGASTRNAGFACVGSIGEHLADIEKESEDIVKERILRRYRGLERLKGELGEGAIGYQHCGGYEFFTTNQEYNKVAPHIERFNDWMQELLGEQKVYSEDKTKRYPVIRNRLEGALHPGKMMQALAQKVSAAGIDIKWNTEVRQTSADGSVHLAGGMKLQADRILHAANGFVQHLLPELEIKPARGLVFVTNEMDGLPWKGIYHHDKGYIYFRNVGQRLLIGGARNLDKEMETTDEFGTNPRIKNKLIDFVDNVLGLSSDWEIEQQWSGIMGFTRSKSPVIKQVDDHRYVAAGLSGMGIAIGMDVGKQATEIL